VESDFATRFFSRRHQLPDCFDDCTDVFIVFFDASFEISEFLRKLAICLERLTQPHKRPHDRDIHFHSALAV